MLTTNKSETTLNPKIQTVRLLNIARLALILVDLYGNEASFTKVRRYDNKEVELMLKSYHGSITFTLSSQKSKFSSKIEKARDPAAIVILNVVKKDVLKVLGGIIRSKYNVIGLTKILRLLILKKIQIKGSIMAALSLARCLMIGNNDIYNTLR